MTSVSTREAIRGGPPRADGAPPRWGRGWTRQVVHAVLEVVAAAAQGALALTVGALARSLMRVERTAPNVLAMTQMSGRGVWNVSPPMAWVAALSPLALAVCGLAVLATRAGSGMLLARSEMEHGATTAAAARSVLLAAALRASCPPSTGVAVTIGRAVTLPQELEVGTRAALARRRAWTQLAALAGAVLLVDAPLAALVVAVLAPFALLLRPVRRALRKANGRASAGVVHLVDGIRDVIEHAGQWASWGGTETVTHRVRALERETIRLAAAASLGQSLASASNEIMAALAVVLLVAAFAPTGAASRPTLVPVIVCLVSAYRPLRDLAETAGARDRAEGARRALEEITREPFGGRATPPRARSAPWPSAPLVLRSVGIRIAETFVVRGVDLVVRPGAPVALVGVPGSGKSTLLEAIAGVRVAAEGRISLCDLELGDAPAGPAFRPVAWVPSSPTTLPGTIAENLAPDAPDDAVRLARARGILAELGDRELSTLPDDTRLGAGARRLSSGEGQRLALARALATDLPVLLLDEPTSCLDAACEKLAVETIARHGRGRAVVIVTHRAAPLAIASRVLRLERPSEAGGPSTLEVVRATESERRVAQLGGVAAARGYAQRVDDVVVPAPAPDRT